MAAINIPLSIMFPDILACRLILDLRERGLELSQPTVYHPEGGRFLNDMKINGETASTAVESLASKRSCKSPTMPLSYTTTRTTYTMKHKGLRGFLERATTGGKNMTTTVDSCMLTSECCGSTDGQSYIRALCNSY